MEQLPKGEEIADLLKQISDNGRSSGLEIRKFERKKENINSSYDLVAEVPIEISVQGSFHRIAMFFDQISQMNRIVHVKNIEISIEDDDSGAEVVPLLVEGDIVAFRLLTPVELKAKEELEKKRKKKRR
jgi:type IV pilus assembly protein PilO